MTAATILDHWDTWRRQSLADALRFDDYASPERWDAINEAYEAQWWNSLTGAERLMWSVAEAYDLLLAVCTQAEIARELAQHPILVRQAERLQTQFVRQTIPHGQLKAKLANRAVERYKNTARERAQMALSEAIRDYAPVKAGAGG